MNGLSDKYSFIKALPVWEEGRLGEKNYSLVFRCVFGGAGSYRLAVTGHSRFQIFVNGELKGAGPARAAHGFFRVSEYSLDADRDENVLVILAAGYNVNSFYLTDQPPFLCAELLRGGEIAAATGVCGFDVFPYYRREQKVQRFSFQRPFAESYFVDGSAGCIFSDPSVGFNSVKICVTEPGKFIVHSSPLSVLDELYPREISVKGRLVLRDDPPSFDERSYLAISEKLKGYKKEELTAHIANEALLYDTKIEGRHIPAPGDMRLAVHGTAVWDFGVNTTGYISLRLTAGQDAVIYAVFGEKTHDGVVYAGENGCVSAVKWTLEGGSEYRLVSFEPYTFRYLQIMAPSEPVTVDSVSVLREQRPFERGGYEPADVELKKVYSAAVETFCQNATDIFMDCPSRERAGWLCDSFFTSRTERFLTGKTDTEHDFLENFILPPSFKCIPEGMLPMCYPADHYDGVFIHNWAMWFALELKEYFDFTGDSELINAAKPRLTALKDFTAGYENSDGLLEKLDSWIFVEWSESNDFVLDVNYPSNMLYSLFLDAYGDLYGDGDSKAKAEKVRETIRAQAFDGRFFADNAVRNKDGSLTVTANHTETAQYYAIFSGTATRELYPGLYDMMINSFGPGRAERGEYPDVPASNAFIGNYLRLIILFREGLYEKMLGEIKAFFGPMAEKTGTLWENMTDGASCNHGFTSFAAVLIREAEKKLSAGEKTDEN